MTDPDERWENSIEHRLERAESKIEGLQRWMNWTLGAGAIIGMMIATFGKHVGALVFS